jgi:hypothetical protein
LISKARGGQDLGKQWVGIKRDRRQHLIEFIAGEGGRGRRELQRRVGILDGGGQHK